MPLLEVDNLWQLLKQRTQCSVDKVFLIDPIEDRIITFGEFFTQTIQLAKWLQQQGIGTGSVVAWQMPTSIDAAMLMFALSRLGVTQAPIIYQYREREITEILLQSKPDYFFVVDKEGSDDCFLRAKTVVASLPDNQITVLSLNNTEPADSNETDLPAYQPADSNVRWYFFTSGTTARPKGTRHSDQSLMAGGFFLGQALNITESDVGTIGYPIAHIGGIVYCAMAIRAGIPIVILARYSLDVVVKSFRQYSVTLAGGSTAHYQMLLEEQRKHQGQPLLPAMRLIAGGGAAKPAALFSQVKDELGVKIIHAYGMTEAPITSSNTPNDTDQQLMHTDGAVMPNLEVKVIDPQGNELAQGENGEILLRGANLCQGYLIAEQTEAAFDNDGFFHTGDIGVLHADGHIAITGRLKDVIIRKGENISAREIEDLLAKHPKVKDVAVIGLPDEQRGELVCAVVEPIDLAEPMSMSEMQEFLFEQKLMRQKIPERLEIMAQLPRNESLQKVQKNILREKFSI